MRRFSADIKCQRVPDGHNIANAGSTLSSPAGGRRRRGSRFRRRIDDDADRYWQIDHEGHLIDGDKIMGAWQSTRDRGPGQDDRDGNLRSSWPCEEGSQDGSDG